MFLNKNSTIKWKRLWIASALMGALVFAGFYGLDNFLMPHFQKIHWNLHFYIDSVDTWKILASISVAGFFLAKIVQGLTSRKYRFSGAMQNSFFAIILGEFVTVGLNYIVGRMRPPFERLNPFSASDIWHSFPSGNAVAVFAMFVSIGLIYPKIKPFTWAIAIIVSVSKICYGMHFPSDVLAGAFIGMVCADLIVYSKRRFF